MAIKDINSNRKNDEPIIIMIGGGWSSGKSSTSIRLAYKLGIANIIHTDVLRCSIRALKNISDGYNASLSTYETWKSEGKIYSPQNLYNGFLKQCKIVLPSIKSCILEANKYGKDTIIEGMHLHPLLVNEIDNKSQIIYAWLTYPDDRYEKQITNRCHTTYQNRDASRYLKKYRSEKIIQLNKMLLSEAQKNKAHIINIEKYDPVIILSQLYNKTKTNAPTLPPFWNI